MYILEARSMVMYASYHISRNTNKSKGGSLEMSVCRSPGMHASILLWHPGRLENKMQERMTSINPETATTFTMFASRCPCMAVGGVCRDYDLQACRVWKSTLSPLVLAWLIARLLRRLFHDKHCSTLSYNIYKLSYTIIYDRISEKKTSERKSGSSHARTKTSRASWS